MKLTQQNLGNWLEIDSSSPTGIRWRKNVIAMPEEERFGYEREIAGTPAGYLRVKAKGKEDYFLYVSKTQWPVETILRFLKDDLVVGSGSLRHDFHEMLVIWSIQANKLRNKGTPKALITLKALETLTESVKQVLQ